MHKILVSVYNNGVICLLIVCFSYYTHGFYDIGNNLLTKHAVLPFVFFRHTQCLTFVKLNKFVSEDL